MEGCGEGGVGTWLREGFPGDIGAWIRKTPRLRVELMCLDRKKKKKQHGEDPGAEGTQCVSVKGMKKKNPSVTGAERLRGRW